MFPIFMACYYIFCHVHNLPTSFTIFCCIFTSNILTQLYKKVNKCYNGQYFLYKPSALMKSAYDFASKVTTQTVFRILLHAEQKFKISHLTAMKTLMSFLLMLLCNTVSGDLFVQMDVFLF